MEATKEKVIDLKPKAEKITEEELKSLQGIVDQNNAIQFKIGAVETQKHELVHKHASIQKQIAEAQSEFSKKYGTFDINLADGTINYPAENGQPRN
tara:strand:+ start:138 stop:425 length:288 start_codon:yes stop_codon:yes gene_type:complete